MKKLLLSLLILLSPLWAESGVDMAKLPSYSTTYNPNANPHKDLEDAMSRATKSGKPILMIVGGDWCKWCGTLDNLIDDRDDIAQSLYGTFEVIRVYKGKRMNKEAKSLLKQLPPFKGTPHFYVLDAKAKLLESFDTTVLERGYGYNRHKVSAWIKKHAAMKQNNKGTK